MSSDLFLTFEVLTPEGLILKADRLKSIRIPLVDGGTIGIRPMHAPLIAETTQGKVQYRTEIESNEVELHAGILDIYQNMVTILTAGKVSEIESEIIGKSETEYNRLMQTLIDHLYPEQKDSQQLE